MVFIKFSKKSMVFIKFFSKIMDSFNFFQKSWTIDHGFHHIFKIMEYLYLLPVDYHYSSQFQSVSGSDAADLKYNLTQTRSSEFFDPTEIIPFPLQNHSYGGCFYFLPVDLLLQ